MPSVKRFLITIPLNLDFLCSVQTKRIKTVVRTSASCLARSRTFAILGATGRLGPFILKSLVAEGFAVTTITRESSTATTPAGVRATQIPDSFPAESLVEAFRGQDAVVSALPPDEELDGRIIESAEAAGVYRFIPSEYGSNAQNAKSLALVALFRIKAKAIDLLKTKQSPTFTWTAVLTGPFFDWGLTTGFLGFDLKNHTAKIFDGGKGVFSTTALPTIGLAVARSLKAVDETANKFVYVSSFETTQLEILASVEKATGKKFTVTDIQTDQQLAAAQELIKQGQHIPAVMTQLLVIFYACGPNGEDGGYGSDFSKDGELANKLLGLEPGNLDELVAKAVKEVQG